MGRRGSGAVRPRVGEGGCRAAAPVAAGAGRASGGGHGRQRERDAAAQGESWRGMGRHRRGRRDGWTDRCTGPHGGLGSSPPASRQPSRRPAAPPLDSPRTSASDRCVHLRHLPSVLPAARPASPRALTRPQRSRGWLTHLGWVTGFCGAQRAPPLTFGFHFRLPISLSWTQCLA